MKIFLDTCVFDWIIDNTRGQELLDKIKAGVVEPIVFSEVSKEIHDVPEAKAQRREQLLALLRPFFPVRPTHVAVAGLARSGAARSAPVRAEGLREELKTLGLHKLDVIHLMNAHFERCPVFVTLDKEDILRRKDVLQRLLGLEILTPEQLLVRLADVTK
jgi:predicted nucleic acid-binding protein